MAAIHRTVPVQVWADVDEGVAALVTALNRIEGVRTHNCCQGSLDEGGQHPYPAYVAVSWNTEQAEAAIERYGSLCAEGTNHGTLYPSVETLEGLRADASEDYPITDAMEEAGPRIPSPDETPAAPEMREALTLHSLAKGQAPEAISAIGAMERAATAKRLSLGVLCRDWHDERGKDWIVYDPKAPVGTTVAAGPFETQAEAHAALEQIVQAAARTAYWSYILKEGI